MKPVLLLLSSMFVLFLSACNPAIKTQPVVSIPTETAPAPTQAASDGIMRTDQQGAVIMEVTPLNLDAPGQTLDFQISMNTHSVDLSMDLATLATLATDAGLQAEAISWDGPSGGHHVDGTLSFLATVNGKLLLEGASQLRLTIRSVDANARIFTWSITR
ncbi:MAG: hypothetical protein IMZ62_14470 [Chloroflexi bacterium]|nr:hypothetical protein [Chloroflexota bacterium]